MRLLVVVVTLPLPRPEVPRGGVLGPRGLVVAGEVLAGDGAAEGLVVALVGAVEGETGAPRLGTERTRLGGALRPEVEEVGAEA